MTALAVTLSVRDLTRLVENASAIGAARALAAITDPRRPLTALAAAKRAGVRVSTLLEALRSKELPAEFTAGTYGGRGKWTIQAEAVDAWKQRHHLKQFDRAAS